NYDSKTPEDFIEKKKRMRVMCKKVGRDFDELKWSLYLCTSVIGKDTNDLEKKKSERLKQHWLFEEITDEIKPKVLEAMLRQELSGTVDTIVKELSKFKNELDVLILGLPMVGDLLKNGLDTIKILRDHIIPRF
ncbi:MAG: hypothetical protein ACFFCT_10735, partial [Candidatus Odinarchaeota archaeon]